MEKYLKAKHGPEVQVIPFILKEAGDYKMWEKVVYPFKDNDLFFLMHFLRRGRER
ncbi:hypothetical protein [Klebsiella pneumoniae]|uniref:hypothetical protein n=1 Tax=Klebsiella pneumoniae TaxID=573 RepID=UPI0029CAB531|nr:hypothetical protein [Klebsiella pneumoniae]WPH86322.1 hypothetical protein R8546_16310 [Klebsiella pneumoniae]